MTFVVTMIMAFVAIRFVLEVFVYDIVHTTDRAFSGLVASAAFAMHRADIGRSIFLRVL